MIQVTIIQTTDQRIRSIQLNGHADYAESGSDIVCSAVSVLVINTINALAVFTSQKFETDEDEDAGNIIINFIEDLNEDAKLLVDTLILGLRTIENDYGEEYIHVNFREV